MIKSYLVVISYRARSKWWSSSMVCTGDECYSYSKRNNCIKRWKANEEAIATKKETKKQRPWEKTQILMIQGHPSERKQQ